MSITCALSAWSIQLLVQPHLPSKCWCNAREPRYLLYNFRPPIQIDDDNTCPLDLYNRLHILEQIESLIRLNQREYVYELGSQPLIVLTTWGRYLSLHKRFNAVLGTKIRSPVLIHYKGEYLQHRLEAAVISCPSLDCPTSTQGARRSGSCTRCCRSSQSPTPLSTPTCRASGRAAICWARTSIARSCSGAAQP